MELAAAVAGIGTGVAGCVGSELGVGVAGVGCCVAILRSAGVVVCRSGGGGLVAAGPASCG